VTATGSRLWAGLNAPDQRLGTGATERYFSCWLAAANYVMIAEELEALIDMRVRTLTTIANPQGRRPRGNGSHSIARFSYCIKLLDAGVEELRQRRLVEIANAQHFPRVPTR
jgi:hypothetical protein